MFKKFAALALVAMLSGCTFNTEYGECLGLDDDNDRNPALKYELNTKNIVLGVIFVETLAAPIVVGLEATYCPVGPANKT